jgi:hypothetical protein
VIGGPPGHSFVHQLRGAGRLAVDGYVFFSSLVVIFSFSVYRLLDSLENIMIAEGRGCPKDYSCWRIPMLAATGSYTAPHQDSNGVGTALRCDAGHKLFFVSIDSNPLITRFDDITFDGALGFEYLFYPPHRYGYFILSPGQTL